MSFLRVCPIVGMSHPFIRIMPGSEVRPIGPKSTMFSTRTPSANTWSIPGWTTCSLMPSALDDERSQVPDFKFQFLSVILVVGMFLTTVAIADDVDDVKALVLRHYVALSAGDVGALIQLHAAGSTNFGPGGALLATFDSLEERRKAFQATRDSGLKFNIQARHLDVRVYGSSTAVATSYWVGTIALPNGNTARPNNRITTVLVKQGGQWKIAHVHNSPVRGPQ